jgi:uridine kinase
MLIIGIAGGTKRKTTVVHQIMNELPQTEVGIISRLLLQRKSWTFI